MKVSYELIPCNGNESDFDDMPYRVREVLARWPFHQSGPIDGPGIIYAEADTDKRSVNFLCVRNNGKERNVILSLTYLEITTIDEAGIRARLREARGELVFMA